MNDLVRVQVPDGTHHLLDDMSTLDLGITKVGLVLESIEHVSSRQ